MKVRVHRCYRIVALAIVAMSAGCAGKALDFSTMKRPERSAQLDAYSVFVGEWDWTAEVDGAAEGSREWRGTAKWAWGLDDRCLRGSMAARCNTAQFQTEGIWSWHPTENRYRWWMFNNWGYPQEGTASYNDHSKTWVMDYTSVGLDGTTSFGKYTIVVVSPSELKWTMQEWADGLHTIEKITMCGTYTKKS